MSERQHDASSTGWYAIELNGAFGYAGAHYVEAQGHLQDEAHHRLVRDGKVVWQGTHDMVVQVIRFDTRAEAVRYFRSQRARQARHRAAAGTPGSTAAKTAVPVIERIAVRLDDRES
jgi:uncharacterized protein (DUF1330 family)